MSRRSRALRKAASLGIPKPLNPVGPDADLGDLPLRSIAVPEQTAANFPAGTWIRCFMLGECSVIVTREHGLFHLSIAHRHRYPTWDEISQARYRILPDDVWIVMQLPPRRYFVNVNRFCFHLTEIEAPREELR